jgi:hypothetical protein
VSGDGSVQVTIRVLAQRLTDALKALKEAEDLAAALDAEKAPPPPLLPPEPPDGSVVAILDSAGHVDSLWLRDDGHSPIFRWANLAEGQGLMWAQLGNVPRLVVLYEPGVTRVPIPDPDDRDAVEALGLAALHADSEGLEWVDVRAVLRVLRDGTWRS